MIFINIFLFTITSILMLYNINSIVCLVSNLLSTIKPNLSFFSFLVCAICYTLIRNNIWGNTTIELSLWFLYCSLLLLNLLYLNKQSFKKNFYICLLYIQTDSIIQSTLRYVIYPIFNEYPPLAVNIFISTVSSTTLFIITCLIKKKANSILFAINHIPTHIYILILLALFFSGGLLENQIFTTENIVLQNNLTKTFTVICIFLLVLIIFLLVFNCISSLYFENQSSLLEKQVETQVKYYKKIDKLNDDVRQFRHDYRNHLLCIQGMLKAQEYDEAIAYAEKLTEHTAASSPKYFTGNSIADSILNDKSEYAQNIGAEIKCDGIIHEDIPAIDICIILANALDNALEACEKITDSSPKIISVKCDYFKCIQLICITNPVSENVVIHNNNIETSKSDKTNHGIGLYNIRNTVAKYNGEFDITCDNNVFTLDIALKVH